MLPVRQGSPRGTAVLPASPCVTPWWSRACSLRVMLKRPGVSFLLPFKIWKEGRSAYTALDPDTARLLTLVLQSVSGCAGPGPLQLSLGRFACAGRDSPLQPSWAHCCFEGSAS